VFNQNRDPAGLQSSRECRVMRRAATIGSACIGQKESCLCARPFGTGYVAARKAIGAVRDVPANCPA
jgi:hypothetical protein